MKAGAGRAEIHIPAALFPLEAFGTVHDPLHIRVLLLESGQGFALVSAEMTSLRDYAVEKMAATVAALTGLPRRRIWICVTHTFSAPHTRSQEALERGGAELRAKNDALCDAIDRALRQAIRRAQATLQPVRIGYGVGCCKVNVSRDVKTGQGWWLGQNEEGYSDHSLPVLRFDSAGTGKPLAILFNYDVQSSVMDGVRLPGGACPVTGDLAGAASHAVEEAYGAGTTAIFLLGAAGDQAPRRQARQGGAPPAGDPAQAGFALCLDLGRELADCVLRTCGQIRTAPCEAPLRFARASCLCPGQRILEPRPSHPVKGYSFVPQPPRACEAELVAAGGVLLVGVKPELSSCTAHALKKEAGYALTMVGTMVNGGAKYMPEAGAYDRVTYEAMNSAYGKGAAEKLARCILQRAAELAGTRPQNKGETP